MGSQSDSKLNALLKAWLPATVVTQAGLDRQGVYRQLADKYVSSGWLERLERGVYVRAGQQVDVFGAVHGLQNSGQLDVHPGGATALALAGYGHHATKGREPIWLFGPPRTRLPAWFTRHDWGQAVRYRPASLFEDTSLGLKARKVEGFELRISTPERAMLEVVYDVPKSISAGHAMATMTGLTNARPATVQNLLSACRSVKAKRLFLLMAEEASHSWVSRLHVDELDLGRGKRALGGGGHYYPRYEISLPEPLSNEGGAEA